MLWLCIELTKYLLVKHIWQSQESNRKMSKLTSRLMWICELSFYFVSCSRIDSLQTQQPTMFVCISALRATSYSPPVNYNFGISSLRWNQFDNALTTFNGKFIVVRVWHKITTKNQVVDVALCRFSCLHFSLRSVCNVNDFECVAIIIVVLPLESCVPLNFHLTHHANCLCSIQFFNLFIR